MKKVTSKSNSQKERCVYGNGLTSYTDSTCFKIRVAICGAVTSSSINVETVNIALLSYRELH